MGSSRLPTDDLELEMEEVEGLVNGRNGGGGRRNGGIMDNLAKIKFKGVGGPSKPPSRGRSGIGTAPTGGGSDDSPLPVRCVERCQRSRSALLFLVVGVVVLILAYNGEGEVKELERGGRPGLADVEGKGVEDGRPANVAADADAAAAEQPQPQTQPEAVPPKAAPEPEPEPEPEHAKEQPAPEPAKEPPVPAPEPAKAEEKEEEEDRPAPEPAKAEEGKDEGKRDDASAPPPEPAKAEEKKEEGKKEEGRKGDAPAKEEGKKDEGKKDDAPAPAPAPEPPKEEKRDGEKKKDEPPLTQKEEPKKDDAKPPKPKPRPKKAPHAQPDEPWRAPDIDLDRKKALVDRWGEWHFWDGDGDTRPKEDYCGKYPHRDIAEDDFPDNCWQVDAVYVNHFLDAASNLVQRAQEAIYTEYGHGKPEDGSPMPGEAMVERAKMFRVREVDLGGAGAAAPPDEFERGGGWSTRGSLEGLKRRLLHAMMTNDSFTVVMGGSNAAAGGGNHFSQSYPMQFHAVLEPVFARLGVRLVTRNAGQEGLGTLHTALGAGSLLGDEVDMVVWDSEETEESKSHLDLIARQALLGGNRVPVLWGGNFEVLRDLHEKAGVDVGQHGWGWAGVPLTTDEEQAKTLPWAARFLRCDGAGTRKDLCDRPEVKFSTKCWIDRDDVKPPREQDVHLEGQDAKHPGHRWHRLLGRVLAFTVLDVLQDAVSTWSDVTITGGHPLPDEYWHIGDYYKEMREKVAALESGACGDMKEHVPERLCRVPVRARTEYTPRADPDNTSISSVLKPAEDGYVPEVQEEMLYDGPDRANPATATPDDAVDVAEIVSLGMDQDEKADGRWRRTPERLPTSAAGAGRGSDPGGRATTTAAAADAARSRADGRRRRGSLADEGGAAAAVVPGTGWEIAGELPGRCDGTANGRCGRLPSSKCLLSGHVDSRGGVLGNEFSGWLVMDIRDVREGVVVLKLETDHKVEESKRTEGWTAVNGGKRRLGKDRSMSSRRTLLPDGFQFDFAIDENIQTLDKKRFEEKITKPQDNIELLTVLDDPSVEKDNLEVAIRLRGCGRDCTIALTHVYWA